MELHQLAHNVVFLVLAGTSNGVNLTDGGRISGAGTATLAISSLTQADAGAYSVVVANSYGSLGYATRLHLFVSWVISDVPTSNR